MDFDDSLFDDHISINRKEKKGQDPYSVRRQDLFWFLSDTNNADSSIEKLKYKADYLYAQSRYTEAIRTYDQLMLLIPKSSTILHQEVWESRVICLIKAAQIEEADLCLKQMLKEEKLNTNLWHLIFTIEREKNSLEAAIFAMQQCLSDNEEVALYWLELAEMYALHSSCFHKSSDINTEYLWRHSTRENINQGLISKRKKNPINLATNLTRVCLTCKQSPMTSCSMSFDAERQKFLGNVLLRKEIYVCIENETGEGSSWERKEPDQNMLCDKNEETMKMRKESNMLIENVVSPRKTMNKMLSSDKYKDTSRMKDQSNTAYNFVSKSSAMIEKESVYSIVEQKDLLLINEHAKAETSNGDLSPKVSNSSVDVESDESHFLKCSPVTSNVLKSYAEAHHYCYCALCSLIMSRFLADKYTAHNQLTENKTKSENNRKVDNLIKNISCATSEVVDEIRWLFRVKSSSKIKSFEPSGCLENMENKVQEFNNHWFHWFLK